MNTRQHNLYPVEHTLCVSWLSGRPADKQARRERLGRGLSKGGSVNGLADTLGIPGMGLAEPFNA